MLSTMVIMKMKIRIIVIAMITTTTTTTIMTTLKGAIPDFKISSLRYQLSLSHTLKWPGRNYAKTTRNTSCAYRVLPH